jgi:lon-related putative ATP-dependent protease
MMPRENRPEEPSMSNETQLLAGSNATEALRKDLRLSAAALRAECDTASLGFGTTAELEPLQGGFGQGRAVRAIHFGIGIKQPGYNLFALGPPAASSRSAVHGLLCEVASAEPPPDDFIYVNNFDDPRRPRVLRLPPGRANALRAGMLELVAELGAAIPSLFESEDYKSRRRSAEMSLENERESTFERLEANAEAQNIAILRSPMGFAFAPKKDGKIIDPDSYRNLSQAERDEIEKKIAVLQEELRTALEALPRLERERRQRITQINREMAKGAIESSIREINESFKDVPAVTAFLSAVAKDLVDNVDVFLRAEGPHEEGAVVPSGPPVQNDPRFKRYLVKVMVSSTGCAEGETIGAPVILEEHPTLANLVGKIEHISHMGTLLTDFTLIQPGSLHRANGGYLIIDARDLLLQPFAWDALKRCLRTNAIKIESAIEQMNLASTISLEPEPIPLSVKVALVGEPPLYHALSQFDPDFPKLFKVQAEFEDEAERTPSNVALFARFVATVIRESKLKPFEAAAVARLSEEAARMADDSERLSLQTTKLADLVREADYWAGNAGSAVTQRAHVDRAVQEQVHRADRIREKSHEAIARGILLLDVRDAKLGQVNGLSVLTIGDFRFGRPSRITAKVRMGSGKVVDIEREVELGGPIHSKGVLILSSFLASRYALDEPVSLSANLVFEQSYGGVEGDSASAAELFALMSALAEVPISQSFAVTGSVNQMGEIQAIGGVNEKIEGFFDVCSKQGLTGTQGVIIPASNVKHLMLRPDVVAAAAEGRFNVYAIRHVDEGIALLTGMAAGERGAGGHFPEDSINGRIEQKLQHYAQQRRRYVLVQGRKQGDEPDA